MGTTTSTSRSVKFSRSARRFGYGVAAIINLGLIYIVNNLVEWDTLPWLTDEFSRLVFLITLSLVIGVAANVVYIANDTVPVKVTGEIITMGVGVFVLARMLAVFPFDYSAYSFNWEFVTRTLLIIGIVGSVVGVIVDAVKLARD